MNLGQLDQAEFTKPQFKGQLAKNKYLSAYILIGVELVTYRTHLVVINSMNAVDVIKGLEILQNLRGSLINIILDHHSSHVALLREGTKDRRTRLIKILQGNTHLLGAAGIRLTVAAGKRHQKVGRCEHMVLQVKKLLLSSIKSYIFNDYFDMNHKISLMQLLINERPIFFP